MASKNAALLGGLCFALAACADSATDRSITAPQGRPTLDVSTTAASTLMPFGSDESNASVTPVPSFGIAQAATGGRASGHFDMASPNFGIETEQYSFVALSTGVFPSAKGQMDGKIARPTTFQDIQADVDCLVIFDNQAWISGPLRRLVINGVPQPTAGRYVLWQVQDNGEGANSPPDLATVLYVAFPQACLAYAGSDLGPLPDANVQVSQK